MPRSTGWRHDKDAFAADLARYGRATSTCYRAEGPETLVKRQAESWDTLLGWARAALRRRFPANLQRGHACHRSPRRRFASSAMRWPRSTRVPSRGAGAAAVVTIGGSLVAGLAVLEKMMPASEAWEAVSLDDRWQMEQWGADAEAEAALDAAAARFPRGRCRSLELLD